MSQFALFGLAAVSGLLLQVSTGIGIDPSGAWYEFLVYSLLAVGLYGSVHGIDRSVLRTDLGRILLAITVGVAAKAVLIAAAVQFLSGDPVLALVLGISLAQIDPVSVAAALSSGRVGRSIVISARAQNIIRVWCSFDDPVTIIIAFILYRYLGANDNISYYGIILEVIGNLSIIVLGVVFIWICSSFRYIEKYSPVFLVSVLFSAAYFQFMLAPAVLGLFLRPAIDRYLAFATKMALFMSALLIGLLFTDVSMVWLGIGIGIGVFLAHLIVSLPMSAGLDKADRIYIALAQQNGMTAILLALLFERFHPEIISVAVPAIFSVNILHTVTNKEWKGRFNIGSKIEKI
ncbi:hypothetical protein [Azospirillum lipoferum]|uniref:hypothetical protein n=1 Tax=Azospirillum lipoferum TaxID=193 RepID=UPI0005C848FD|nr:hypothetical protein [Azospirillum lipoferum]